MADFNTIGLQFVQYYYNVFQTNREGLRALFQTESMMSFEGEHFKGVDQITQKFQSLGMQSIAHNILTHDIQPTSSSILVFVTGQLKMDQDEPLKFTQVFNLCPNGSGGYYVHNTIFRLNLG